MLTIKLAERFISYLFSGDDGSFLLKLRDGFFVEHSLISLKRGKTTETSFSLGDRINFAKTIKLKTSLKAIELTVRELRASLKLALGIKLFPLGEKSN